MDHQKAWDNAVDLWGLIAALECLEDTNAGETLAAKGRAGILSVAEKLAQELVTHTEKAAMECGKAKVAA